MRPPRFSLTTTTISKASTLLGLFMILPGPLPPASAQASPGTPEAAASEYMATMAKGVWSDIAKLMHPDALRDFKQMLRPLTTSEGLAPQMRGVFGVGSSAEYDRLSGEQVFERLLGFIARQMPEFVTAVRSAKGTIIGHVDEAPDLAHVVYRMSVSTQGISVMRTSVITMKKYGDTWRALLTGDMEGLAAGMAQAARQSSAAKKPAPKPPARPKSGHK